MQGNAFLGKQKTSDPEYAFMFRGRMDEKYDMCRAVRGHKFRYIRNYMPYRNYGQHLDYLWRAPSVRSWEQAFNNGECNETQSIFWQAKPVEELYDTENDPWEINNLADNPEYKNILVKMRQAGIEWSGKIKDAGFIPEADLKDRTEEMPIYDYMRSGEIDLERVINAADIAISGNSENLETLKTFLKDDESAVRYWGAAGMLILGQKAAPAKADLQSALNDKSANVVTVAAETLYNLGEKEAALKALTAVLKNPNEFARCHALNAIDCMDESSPFIIGEVVNMTKASANINRGSYDLRAARWLFQKWELIPEDYGLSFDW
jgi:hypothetical protein